jgi:hypothetical protein
MSARTNRDELRRPSKRGTGVRLFAVALVISVGFGQLAASWHRASVRHVRCAEHGEVTHLAALSAPGTVAASGRTTLAPSETGAPSEHDHCGVVLAAQAGAHARPLRTAVPFAPPPVVARIVADTVDLRGRAFVLASAPKTSPPPRA